MNLILESGGITHDPTEDDIRGAVEAEEFVILERESDTYLQCAQRDEEPFDYILEYQDGSLKRHYEAVDGPISLERVTAVFIKYLQNDDSWVDDFTWKKMKL